MFNNYSIIILGYFFKYNFIIKGNIIVVNSVVITTAEYNWTEIIHILKTIIATASHMAHLLFIAQPIKCSWWQDKSLTNGLAICVQINFHHIAKTIIVAKIHQFIKSELKSKTKPMLTKKKGMKNIFKLFSTLSVNLWCLPK